MIKSWSKTLVTLALSSGESELQAMAKGAAEGLGLKSVMWDFGLDAVLQIRSDASAAIGIASRQGLGRIRHIGVTDLWLQQRLKAKEFEVYKVNGLDNLSDLQTKPLDGSRITELLDKMGVVLKGVKPDGRKHDGEHAGAEGAGEYRRV